MTDIQARTIEERLGAQNVLRNEPMSAHTSFRIGGPADLFLRVHSLGELQWVLEQLRAAQAPWYIVGRGTNLLVGDGGYRGCILTFAEQPGEAAPDGAVPEFSEIRAEGTVLTVGAGVTMAAAAGAARELGLSGMEFAAGIPGTIGGALVMNAGAYGGSMDQIVETVTLLMPEGEVRTLTAGEMRFRYRHSLLKELPAIALRARLRLVPGDPAVIADRMKELARQRGQKQPLEYPSAGSTFKRPEGNYAGRLIMEAGLAGYAVGGAEVSRKHCGFIINRGGASASDVRAVIAGVRRSVQESAGISLEEEVISLGSFPVP